MSVPEEQLLAALAEKFLAGTATPEEQEQLHQLYDKWIDDEETIVSETQQTEVLRMEILQVIKGRINSRRRLIPFYRKSALGIVAAASILIVTTVLFVYYLQSSSKK